MRHIPYNEFQPSATWVAKATAAKKKLLKYKSRQGQQKFIKDNADVWRALRAELVAFFGTKCWFTDTAEIISKLDVEHFRPKAKAVDLKGVERCGYWWLAFDQDNLRLCGQIPNREFKRCYFPLHESSKAAETPASSWRDELPLFLDPIDLHDVGLVEYADNGELRPRADASDWDKLRVIETNRLFGLGYDLLSQARKTIIQHCASLMQSYRNLCVDEKNLAEPSLVINEKKRGIERELHGMTDPSINFSSVAASCLRNSGYQWAQAIATQQHKRK
ncbi:MAG TPA: hypothetical protein VEA69_02880 [Tepidisphaeraceae bacterium]|nr:hypothetical protein [Tepidisphaeraceae bacterium]